MSRQQAIEVTVTDIPRVWPYFYREGDYHPGCRGGCCPKTPVWCVRHYYRIGSFFTSHYWCDDHLPRHQRRRAEATRATRYGVYKEKLTGSQNSKGR